MNEELKRAIEFDDAEAIREHLEEVDTKDFSHEDFLRFALLVLYTTIDHPISFQSSLSFFEEQIEHFVPTLFLMEEMQNEKMEALLRFIITESLSLTLPELLTEYIDFEQSPKLIDALRHHVPFFPQPSENVLRQILIVARKDGAKVVEDFVVGLIQKIVKNAPVPSYMRCVAKLPTIDVGKQISLPEDPNEIAEELTKLTFRAFDVNISRDELKENFKNRYLNGTDKVREELLASLLESKRIREIDAFHVLGPSNPITENPSRFCELTGGCRMMTCLCLYNTPARENEFDIHKRMDIWKKSNCERCVRRIRRPEYSFRRAAKGGGWKEPFCSPECYIEWLMRPFLEQSAREDKVPITRKEVDNFILAAQSGESFVPDDKIFEILGDGDTIERYVDELRLVAEFVAQLNSKHLYVEKK